MKAIIKFLPDKSKGKATEELLIDGETKVGIKAYAVTLDIKVEDRIKGEWKGYWHVEEIKDNEVLLSNWVEGEVDYEDDQWYNIGDLPIENFKILGEVSPKAMFIEDGKEYEIPKQQDWECKLQYDCSGKIKCLNCGEQDYIIKIKCPLCKQFH